jgi:hypothetical protein
MPSMDMAMCIHDQALSPMPSMDMAIMCLCIQYQTLSPMLYGHGIWHYASSTRPSHQCCMGMGYGIVHPVPDPLTNVIWAWDMALYIQYQTLSPMLCGHGILYCASSTRSSHQCCMGMGYGIVHPVPGPLTNVVWAWDMALCIQYQALSPMLYGHVIWHCASSTRPSHQCCMGMGYGIVHPVPDPLINVVWAWYMALCIQYQTLSPMSSMDMAMCVHGQTLSPPMPIVRTWQCASMLVHYESNRWRMPIPHFWLMTPIAFRLYAPH